MSDRPLHVRVAEALGCKPDFRKLPPGHSSYWVCTCPDGRHLCEGVDGAPNEGPDIESYDTDWSATGPLIERYRITLQAPEGTLSEFWVATTWEWRCSNIGRDGTALRAACRLILDLAEAGRLADPDAPDDGTPPPPPRP